MKNWKVAAAMAAVAAGVGGAIAFRARPAEAACCYFAAQEKDINQPGQKAFITWDPGTRIESFTVQPKFEGNAVDFGMVIPTPSRPKLDEMPRDFFRDLAIYTILLPLPEAIALAGESSFGAVSIAMSDEEGGGPPKNDVTFGVRVLEAGVVGSLDYKIITADRATGLYDWLKENSYVFGGNEETLDFYIQKKWLFTVMKIDPKQMKRNADGSYAGEVTPTRFTFESDRCVYPLKITQISVKDMTDALFYVQSPEPLDLEGDMSWMPSWRMMFLTYMQGCGITEEEQKELDAYGLWLQKIQEQDGTFETTKLEWAKQLDARDLSVLDDPVALWPQAGGAPLETGDQVISLETFLREAREFLGTAMPTEPETVRERLATMEIDYAPARGDIVKVAHPEKSPLASRYVFYPRRDAPAEELKGLTRLKGHLQKDQWLVKFRRHVRRTEMTDDLILVPLPKGREQTYTRIMPTSPP